MPVQLATVESIGRCALRPRGWFTFFWSVAFFESSRKQNVTLLVQLWLLRKVTKFRSEAVKVPFDVSCFSLELDQHLLYNEFYANKIVLFVHAFLWHLFDSKQQGAISLLQWEPARVFFPEFFRRASSCNIELCISFPSCLCFHMFCPCGMQRLTPSVLKRVRVWGSASSRSAHARSVKQCTWNDAPSERLHSVHCLVHHPNAVPCTRRSELCIKHKAGMREKEAGNDTLTQCLVSKTIRWSKDNPLLLHISDRISPLLI